MSVLMVSSKPRSSNWPLSGTEHTVFTKFIVLLLVKKSYTLEQVFPEHMIKVLEVHFIK
jgi:hypothetical protein